MDWWSLGVLTYELLTGASPFTVEGEKNIPADISKRIMKAQPPMPRSFSKSAKDFILKLLNKHPTKRLGGGAHGAQEVKAHAFFDAMQWDDLLHKRVPVPFKPSISGELDTNNFADEFTRQVPTDSPAPHIAVTTLTQGVAAAAAALAAGTGAERTADQLFRGYSYIAPSIIYGNNVLNDNDSSSNSSSSSSMANSQLNAWLKNSAFNQLYEIEFASNLGEGSFSVCK